MNPMPNVHRIIVLIIILSLENNDKKPITMTMINPKILVAILYFDVCFLSISSPSSGIKNLFNCGTQRKRGSRPINEQKMYSTTEISFFAGFLTNVKIKNSNNRVKNILISNISIQREAALECDKSLLNLIAIFPHFFKSYIF